MRSANEKKMFDLLLDEIGDTLQDIEQRCLKLETSDSAKELQIIFRAAHNVKGASQLYGLSEFGAFVHVFEDLLTLLQKAEKPVTSQSVDVLLSAQSFFRDWVHVLRDNPKHVADTTQIKQALLQHMEDLKAGRVIVETGAANGAAGTTASAPKAAEVPSKTAAAVAKPTGENPAAEPEAPGAPAGGNRNRRGGTLRISSEKIDGIMQLIGELSIHQGILWHNFQNNTFNALTCKNAVTLNQKTLKDLYELVLTMRMQSAEGLFQRMERTARDVARDQKKKVTVQLIGADTALDKTVIELVTDPMMHIVRNAVDHGIEDDETRVSIGKTVPACLTIQTLQDSGHVIISIADDGRGLDHAMIYEKAVKKGLVAPGTKMSPDEIIQLIFLPGFSTRDTVTEISGRGVGMDIVQKAIQQIGGQIEIQSEKGKGTTFLISLPASLEIIEGLLVRVSNQLYIIPRQDVDEIIDLDSFEVEKAGRGGRAIRIRKTVVPVEELSDYVGMTALAPTPSDSGERKDAAPRDSAKDVALLIRLPDRTKLALRIDAVIQQQQIVVRPLSDHLKDVPGFAGVTILGNGEPTMILSAAAIAEAYLNWINRQSPRDRDSA